MSDGKKAWAEDQAAEAEWEEAVKRDYYLTKFNNVRIELEACIDEVRMFKDERAIVQATIDMINKYTGKP